MFVVNMLLVLGIMVEWIVEVLEVVMFLFFGFWD